jgi:cytochrome c oxidase subunit III
MRELFAQGYSMDDEPRRPIDDLDASTPRYSQRQVATVGLWLFLASLAMLFAASMLGYILIRLSVRHPNPIVGRAAIPLGSLHFPPELWGSTVLVIGVSIALWRALAAVKRERQRPFRNWLTLSLVLAAGFIAVQTPAMIQLISTHKALRYASGGTALYGLIFFLVLLHALHVVGGIIVLVRVVILGHRDRYDHEHYQPIRHATMYWHFLDLVWLVMFSTFLLTR